MNLARKRILTQDEWVSRLKNLLPILLNVEGYWEIPNDVQEEYVVVLFRHVSKLKILCDLG